MPHLRPWRCVPPTPAGSLPEADDHSLPGLLGEADVLLLYFTASWCGPCEFMRPAIEHIAAAFENEASRVRFAAVDIDRSPGAAVALSVVNVPTVVVLRRGQPVRRLVGVVPAAEVRSALAWAMAS